MTIDSSPVTPPDTLVTLLGTRARTTPEKCAYRFLADGEQEAARFTYAELDARARAIAARLQAAVPAGERALLLYPPGLEFLEAFFGCLYAGVIAVPSYPPKRNRADPRLQAIAADAGAGLVLTDSDVLGELEARLTHTPALRALRWLATDTVATGEGQAWRDPGVGADHLAFLQYTSGSTSTPKGVMVSHRNLLHNLDDLDRGWDHTADSVMVTWLPIFHDMGLIYGALMPLFRGFTCVMLPPSSFLQRPARWLEAIARYRGTHSAAPNFAYDLCVASTTPEQRAALDLRSWIFSLNAAEPVRAETLAAFNAAFAPCGLSPLTVSPGYGLAEATLKVSALPRAEPTRLAYVRGEALARHEVVPCAPDEAGAQPIVGCGWGQVDNRYVIVEPETGAPCAEGRVGEIWFAGPSVTQGYWQRPEETAATFGARLASGEGPFMRTGDLGFLRAGELYVTGRVKDLIILRGLNHYPQDIELTVEKAHPALRPSCSAAFSVELDGAEALVVVQEVERTHLRKLKVDEVVAAIRQAVAEQHELPVSAVVLLRTGSIPKTSSGKIMRRACRQAYLQGELEIVGEWRQPTPAAPAADPAGAPPVLEAAVIETWLSVRLAQRLNLSARQVDPTEPFSRYGLDSVAAVELSGALEAWLGRRLSPTLVYDYPNIRTLAGHLAAQVAVAESAAAPGTTGSGVAADHAVAIIGLGCRFPGAESPAAFWRLLSEGREAISPVPAGRWDPATGEAPAWGGFLEQVDGFDAAFFGIAPREADLMDPQQRLLLEVAYEALEDAGLVPRALAGSATGVFVGISTNDYGRLLARVAAGTDAHAGTGNAVSIAANRISYLLDLRGPSLALDTACSSSLVAVHHAVRSLRAGESSLALVGGVNLLLAPELTTTFARAGMLAPDGRCKTFDAAADGYVRGEGCGVVVLKRLADARRDGDRVLAVIRGSAVNQDGRSNGLTAPNGPAQQAVVRAALRDAGLAPAAVGCIEAHGTGTSLGDPIEANALRDVLLEGRTPEQRCWLGSVKTNIGHLEAAAGIAGLIKLVLALRHEAIPPHLHLRALNPLIQIEGTPLGVATAVTPWRGPGRFAGVSSFGFGGTNAHVIVGEAPAEAPAADAPVRPQHRLVLSARSLPALRALAARYADGVASADWSDLCHAAATRRAAYPFRLALSAERAAGRLADFARGLAPAGMEVGEVTEAPRVAFVFADAASVPVALVRELRTRQPAFRDAFEACRAEIGQRSGWDLAEALEAAALPPERAGLVAFAVQHALGRLWQSWGLEPAAVVGDGAGEFAAAVAAGVLGLGDAVTLLAARVRLAGAAEGRSDFGALLADTRLAPAGQAFYSTTVGARLGAEAAQPAHWCEVGARPARLGDLRATCAADGFRFQVELSSVAAGWDALLEAAARAFVAGLPVRWESIDQGHAFRRVDLPGYPFQRQRHWFEDVPVAGATEELARLANDPALSAEDRAAIPRLIAALKSARSRPDDPAELAYTVEWTSASARPAAEAAPGEWLLLGEAPAELRRLSTVQAETFVPGAWRGVIFWAGDESGEAESARLLAALQATTAPLWVITRGAVAVASAPSGTVRLDHAPLWGLGKVAALEQPERWGGLIDLSYQPVAGEGDALIAELLSPEPGEHQVALRGLARFVARLERAVGISPAPPPALRPEASYWITGGTGALGLQVARWLVARGARKLVLSARGAASPSASATETAEDLRRQGADVRVVAADAAEPVDVRRVIALAEAELGPLRGVVHAAGRLGLEPLATLTPAALQDVLRPKLTAARVLTEALKPLPIDFLVLFSSIAAVWGARGQAHYAAANHALDALAHRERALGRPVLSVNWGPWAGGGMAGDAEQAQLARYGLGALRPETALAALDAALAGGDAQRIVARVDWRAFREFFELRGAQPFLARVGTVDGAADGGARDPALVALADLPPADRLARLEAYLQAQVAAVLGFKDGRLPDARQGFFALGMDSMMAVDLRRRLVRALAADLPATLVFDHANIHLLAAHFAAEVLGWNAAAPAPVPSAAPVVAAALEEEDLDAALARRLARLESLIREP